MREWLRHILRALAFGLAATFAVSWVHALVPPNCSRAPIEIGFPPDGSGARVGGIQVRTPRYAGVPRYEWVPTAPLDPATDFDALLESWEAAARRLDEALEDGARHGYRPHLPHVNEWLTRPAEWPVWARLPRGLAADAGLDPDQGLSTDARGFPLPALSCTTFISMSNRQPSAVHWGIPIRSPRGTINDEWMALPLRPIPLNFSLNTIFYASAWLLAALSFTRINRYVQLRRMAKSRCANCAYPRRGLPPTSPCPECGSPPTARY